MTWAGHGYLLVNAAIVRSTVDRDIPGIVVAIQEALKDADLS